MIELPRLLLCTLDAVPAPSGASRRLASTIRALAQRFQVDVLTAGEGAPSAGAVLPGARLLHVATTGPSLPSRLRAYTQAVAQQVASERYAVAHFTDPFSGAVLLRHGPAGELRRVYEALTFPSSDLPLPADGAAQRAALVEQERRCLQAADLVITGSRVTEAFIRAQGVSDSGVEVLPTPVSTGPAPQALRPVPDSALRCIYVGSQAPWQGLDVLLHGLALAARQTDVQLTVLGPRHPEAQPRLEALVAELGLGTRVRFLPPVSPEEVPFHVAEADIALLPLADTERNRAHGGPLAKVGDYIAAGRPVVAADLPVVRERLPEGGVSLFSAGDARALSEALVQLARDPRRREQMARHMASAAAGAVVDAMFQARLHTLYGALLPARRSPAPAPSSVPAAVQATVPAALPVQPLAVPASSQELAETPAIPPVSPPAQAVPQVVQTDVAQAVPSPPPVQVPLPRPRIGGGRAGPPAPSGLSPPPTLLRGEGLARPAGPLRPPRPAPPPLPRRSALPLTPAAALAAADEAELLEAIELEEVDEVGGGAITPVPLVHAPPPVSDDEEPPVNSILDPWLAHILQGYSPPGRKQPVAAGPAPAPRLLPGRVSGEGEG